MIAALALAVSVLAIKVEKRIPAGRPMMGGNDLPSQIPDEWLREFFGNRIPRFEMPDAPRGDRHAMGQGSGFILLPANAVCLQKPISTVFKSAEFPRMN